MNFDFYLPTRFLSGFGAVKQNPSALLLGKKALLVTGKNSAKVSGALDDVLAVLSENNVDFVLFSEVSENPPLEMTYRGGRLAFEEGADFVIAIGGGSAIDAGKAIAAYAANPSLERDDLFSPSKHTAPSLPLAAIPTTAGTGSEANPYSVLTLPGGEQKKTFQSLSSYPKAAFLDPAYTRTLSHRYTLSTALDAFHHALESYLSPKSTPISEAFALFAAKEIWEVLSLYPDTFTDEMRESLLYAAAAGGAAINTTGTGFPHPLGYPITLLDGIPHGAACAAFAADYLNYNEKTETGKEKLERFYLHLGVKPKVLKEYLPALLRVELSLTEEEIAYRVSLIENAKNYANSPYVLSKDEMLDIYRSHFLKKSKQ